MGAKLAAFLGHLGHNVAEPYRLIGGVAARHPVLAGFIGGTAICGALLAGGLPAVLGAVAVLTLSPAAGALLADLASLLPPGKKSWSKADAYARWGGTGLFASFLAPLLVEGAVVLAGGSPELLAGTTIGRLLPYAGYAAGLAVESKVQRAEPGPAVVDASAIVRGAVEGAAAGAAPSRPNTVVPEATPPNTPGAVAGLAPLVEK